MALKFTGDFEALNSFADRLDLAAAAGTTRTINSAMAEETVSLIRDGFARSEDPYGHPWEPLKFRGGQPLRDKGGLQASWKPSSVTTHGFRITSSKDYAPFHQEGTGVYGKRHARIVPVRKKALAIPGVGVFSSVAGTPKRRMVPNRGQLPRKWKQAYVEAAQEILTQVFEGK